MRLTDTGRKWFEEVKGSVFMDDDDDSWWDYKVLWYIVRGYGVLSPMLKNSRIGGDTVTIRTLESVDRLVDKGYIIEEV